MSTPKTSVFFSMPWLRRSLIAGGIFGATFWLYLTTLAPSVVTLFDDSLEFQLVTYQLGIAHPTGYPLYTLLGKLFTFLPVGDVAYRVNLMSAVFGALTTALVYLLILQVAGQGRTGSGERGARSGERRARSGERGAESGERGAGSGERGAESGEWLSQEGVFADSQQLFWEGANAPVSWPVHGGGVIGALLLAVGLVFWGQATVAEVYTLNAFFVAALLLLAVTMPPASVQEPALVKRRERRILTLAFVAGLSLTHHRTILLLLPALALYLYLTQRAVMLKPKILGLSILFGLAPLLLYLYLPLRGHIGSLDGTYHNTWAGFWQQVSAGGYGLFIFDNPFGHERSVAFYWDLLKSQFYTVVPGFIGIFYLLWIGRRTLLGLTGLAFLTYTGFNLFYKVSDIEVFFIPVFLIWAVWSGTGAALLLNIALTLKYYRWRPVLAGIVLVIFGLIVFHLFRDNKAQLKESYTWEVHDYGLDMLEQLPTGGEPVVIGILGEVTLLRYFQQTEKLRPDVETLAADPESDRLAAVEKALVQGESVYLTRELPGAAERWSLNAVGPLIRVDFKPVTSLPADSNYGLNQPVIPGITLRGYSLSRPPHTGEGLPPLRLTVYWQVTDPLTADLKISARLLAASGEPLATIDAAPVHFAYPTTAWRLGEIISDVYDLNLPSDLASGSYAPLLIWYDPAQNAAEVGRVELEPVVIEERE